MQKQGTILAWFHKTALAYSIKDLEKLIPSVASINGMAVKDYLQALQDDGLIRTEKIGSGNWYWSFPSEAKKAKVDALAKAQSEFDKISATAADLQAKVDLAGAARAEDEEVLAETGPSRASSLAGGTDSPGGDRRTLVAKHEDLTKQVEKLRTELAAYSDYDPVELDKKIDDTQRLRAAADRFTEHIYCMEGWLKERVLDRESQTRALKELYGDEWDEDEGGLREL
ncbi:uncharacterized protein EKO05_0008447 [Ascochyta rabiei]|uniref:uncharacterized protein n=1 Tax=Didymella rabiei TaxID=5454 RepID=UPI00220D32AF|nr:uncharacterized protein EKO05_0008447 [Ascochyta rabiei]UPX18134.1 hypothetical protein EKO05_0008447 [Ascochyta rabiei]